VSPTDHPLKTSIYQHFSFHPDLKSKEKMATSKEDIKHGVAQAKLSEDEMLRTGYVHGTPLEAGKIADSEPVKLFDSADKITHAADQAKQSQNEGADASSTKDQGDGNGERRAN
jgi:Ca2+-dependent lipid-binding protein